MSLKREPINVRVSKRILWFGSEAYPLPNITRTNTLKIEPRRGLLIRRYVISVAMWVVVAGIVLSVVPGTTAVLAGLGVVGWLAFKTIRLVELLKIRLYELVIETAAGSHRGLVTDNREVVHELIARITDAIDNPLAEFAMQVENFKIGDNNNINFSGQQNVNNPI